MLDISRYIQHFFLEISMSHTTISSSQSDHLQRFIFDNSPIRGEWVHLNQTWENILRRRDYPSALQQLLGEMMAAAALLAATIKLKGRLVLQTKSSGPVSMMVVECTSQYTMRAMAQWDNAAVGESEHLTELTGAGTLALTIETVDNPKPYQGIVALEGKSIAQVIENYFTQSEQLPTRIVLAANAEVTAGLLVQQLPSASQDEGEDEAWSRISHLTDTVTSQELLTLPAEIMLKRLFFQEQCRLLKASPIQFGCNCSRQRVANTIQLLGEKEARKVMIEQGVIEVVCEFCNEHYRFNQQQIETIFQQKTTSFHSSTVH